MLQIISDFLVYKVFRLSASSNAAGIINFFIYDSLKIIVLLFFMISFIGFLRTFLPQERLRRWLNKGGVFSNFFACLFGAVTPFCSCSSIPIFFSFLEANIPLGIAFSFLITSPIINEYLVVLMFGFFGWKITFAYVANGILIGLISGVLLGRMHLEKYIVKDILPKDCAAFDKSEVYGSLVKRVKFGLGEARSIIKKLWIWILVGVGIGSLIHNFIPESSVQAIVGRAGAFSVPAATLIGVPLYGSCAAILPVAIVLFQKGFPLGTALSFMMAVSALSLPEAIMLRRVMQLKLIAIFFGITAFSIMLTGYMFNLLQRVLF